MGTMTPLTTRPPELGPEKIAAAFVSNYHVPKLPKTPIMDRAQQMGVTWNQIQLAKNRQEDHVISNTSDDEEIIAGE